MLDAPTDTLLVNRRNLPFTLDGGIARRAAIGLVVLATDQTIEHEWRQMLGLDGVAFYESRIYNSPTITPETLAEMASGIAAAAALIKPGIPLDALAYGCTSGAMVIGEERVFALLREAWPDKPCTTPITAALNRLRALGARRIALLTPYIDEINQSMRRYIEARGIAVVAMGSFNNGNDNEAAGISAASLDSAISQLDAEKQVDAVFVACTSLRIPALIEGIETQLGKPVISSNHAMAWHALRLAGYAEPVAGFGRLFRL